MTSPSVFASGLILVRGLPQWEGPGLNQNKVIICLPTLGVLQNLLQVYRCPLPVLVRGRTPGSQAGEKDTCVSDAEWGTRYKKWFCSGESSCLRSGSPWVDLGVVGRRAFCDRSMGHTLTQVDVAKFSRVRLVFEQRLRPCCFEYTIGSHYSR